MEKDGIKRLKDLVDFPQNHSEDMREETIKDISESVDQAVSDEIADKLGIQPPRI